MDINIDKLIKIANEAISLLKLDAVSLEESRNYFDDAIKSMEEAKVYLKESGDSDKKIDELDKLISELNGLLR